MTCGVPSCGGLFSDFGAGRLGWSRRRRWRDGVLWGRRDARIASTPSPRADTCTHAGSATARSRWSARPSPARSSSKRSSRRASRRSRGATRSGTSFSDPGAEPACPFPYAIDARRSIRRGLGGFFSILSRWTASGPCGRVGAYAFMTMASSRHARRRAAHARPHDSRRQPPTRTRNRSTTI